MPLDQCRHRTHVGDVCWIIARCDECPIVRELEIWFAAAGNAVCATFVADIEVEECSGNIASATWPHLPRVSMRCIHRPMAITDSGQGDGRFRSMAMADSGAWRWLLSIGPECVIG
ncbi:MAG: hypothetical protein WAU05_12015, partial [Nitrospira sp.]